MREIQDSDDEFDHLEADIPPQQHQGASAQQHADHGSPRQHGTGSTASLQKALQAEHRAQFQTQPSPIEPQSSVSLPEPPSKRRKLSAAPAPLQLREASSPKKYGPGTNGKRCKSTLSSPSPGQSGHAATDMGSRPRPEAGWNLEGTMRENYAHHEPLAMFPEPSSTIANATQTQLHIMQGVRAPVMLGSSSEADVPRNLLPPEPSVPWSEAMKLTPDDPLYPTESSNEGGPVSELTANTPTSGGAAAEALASQQSQRGLLTLDKGSPLRHEVPQEDSRPLQSTDRSIKSTSITQTLKTPAVTFATNQRGHEQSSLLTKQQTDALSDNDDDFSIGLPREQYKPRPSRSRSLRVDIQDTIDYSVVPERAKKVSKRRETANVSSSVEIPTTPQKIQQICDMGFTPTTTKRALQQNSGDVTSTVDWLVTNHIGEDELASHSTPRRKPFTPKSQNPVIDPEGLQLIMCELNHYRKEDPVNPQSHAAAPATANDILQPESNGTEYVMEHIYTATMKSPKVHVVIPKKTPTKASPTAQKSPEPPKKKLKRRKTTLDQPESGQPTGPLGLPEPVLEKKRGRGRPKKAVESATSADAVQEAPMQNASEKQQHDALQVVEVNVVSGQVPASDVAINGAVSEGSAAVSKQPLAPTPPSEADKQSTKAQTTEASLKLPTPAAKGKVPYRVGLSKRARIAPLLRVLKK